MVVPQRMAGRWPGGVPFPPALVPLLIVLAALLLRAPWFGAAVLDPDEGLYLVQARAWLGGGWPYQAVWDMHPLGAPGLLAVANLLVPAPLLALRLAGVAAVAAAGLLLRALVRRLGAGEAAGLAAGLLYVAHSLVLGGLATNTEILFAPFVVLGALLLLGEARQPAPPRAGQVLAAGLAFGVALWVKQVVALEASALWLTLVGVALARRRMGWARVPLLAFVFALGCALPSAATAGVYALRGEFESWLHANLWVLFGYGEVAGEAPGLRRGLLTALPHLLWLMAAALAVRLGARRDGGLRGQAALLLPWLVAAAVQAAAPGKYFDHYFLMLLPPLSALAALGLAGMARAVARRRWRAGLVLGLAGAIAAMPVAAAVLPRLAGGIGWRIADPPHQVAAIARQALGPGEVLWVANWHPVVYALAGVDPPTRFAFPGHLAGVHAGLTGIDPEAEIARVLALPPRLIVIAPARWRLMRPAAQAAVTAALAEYELIATVADAEGPVEVWRRR